MPLLDTCPDCRQVLGSPERCACGWKSAALRAEITFNVEAFSIRLTEQANRTARADLELWGQGQREYEPGIRAYALARLRRLLRVA